MNLKRTAFLSLLLTAPLSAYSAIQTEAGRKSSVSLLPAGTARANAMGGAFTAVADDVNSAVYNPAGLGLQRYLEVSFSHQDRIENSQFSQAGGVVPLSGVSSSNVRDFGAAGFSVSYLDFGDFKQTDAAGNRTGKFDADDLTFSLSYGKKIFDRLSVGGRYKKGESSIANVDADFDAVDVGVLFQPNSQWMVGASVENLGGDVSFKNESFSLPKRVLVGASVRPCRKLLAAADIVDSDEDNTNVRSGLEYQINSFFLIRGGFHSGNDLGHGLTAGAGFRVERAEAFFFPVKRLQIDYAFKSLSQTEDEGSEDFLGSHQVSISFQFGEDGHGTK